HHRRGRPGGQRRSRRSPSPPRSSRLASSPASSWPPTASTASTPMGFFSGYRDFLYSAGRSDIHPWVLLHKNSVLCLQRELYAKEAPCKSRLKGGPC
uniref:Uncharacterized protein n=1 Tax=Triticum urartu TaxID=4572 RepID=A0A8R7UUZ0_TRIUA